MGTTRFVHLSGMVALAFLLSACLPGQEPGSNAGSTPSEVGLPPTLAATGTALSPRPSSSPAAALPTGLPAEGATGNADVLHVRAVLADDGSWTFHVTVLHPDIGWEDYADGWDVITPGGTVLKPDPSSPFTRLLLHPHENEQPFTRSQSGIVIPPDVTQVRVRAHDLVDGFGGKEVQVNLTTGSGEGYEVERRN